MIQIDKLIKAKTGKFREDIMCANCGGQGHLYKNCNHPITSYGVICFKIAYNTESAKMEPMYLMVQRKDSLSYVEFIRGKYSLENRLYLVKLFSNMTHLERLSIKNRHFDHLWKELWQVNDCHAFQKEYNDAKMKFNILRNGFLMKNPDNSDMFFFDVEYLINNTESTLTETEWGFPKGRRNINEDDYSCAVREFKEETGIANKHLLVFKDIKPFEEVFSGTNHVRYKHTYYLGMVTETNDTPSKKIQFNPFNKLQCKEIKDMKWFLYDQAQSRIRDSNVERKELFKRVNATIMKNICSFINNG